MQNSDSMQLVDKLEISKYKKTQLAGVFFEGSLQPPNATHAKLTRVHGFHMLIFIKMDQSIFCWMLYLEKGPPYPPVRKGDAGAQGPRVMYEKNFWLFNVFKIFVKIFLLNIKHGASQLQWWRQKNFTAKAQ